MNKSCFQRQLTAPSIKSKTKYFAHASFLLTYRMNHWGDYIYILLRAAQRPLAVFGGKMDPWKLLEAQRAPAGGEAAANSAATVESPQAYHSQVPAGLERHLPSITPTWDCVLRTAA